MTQSRAINLLPACGVAVALLLPLGWLAWRISLEVVEPTSGLGADPGEAVVHFMGEWSLRILLLAFSVSPLYRITRWQWVARRRRMVGLFAFAYVSLHALAYGFFFLEFELAAFIDDFAQRVYITAGIGAWLCLLPMALTSTRAWQRRLGRKWRQLHRLVYLALGLALLHLLWLTRDGYGEVLLYALWFGVLLALRFSNGWLLRAARGER